MDKIIIISLLVLFAITCVIAERQHTKQERIKKSTNVKESTIVKLDTLIK
jgi:hypothetical protein